MYADLTLSEPDLDYSVSDLDRPARSQSDMDAKLRSQIGTELTLVGQIWTMRIQILTDLPEVSHI